MNQSRYVLTVRDFHRRAGHIIHYEPTVVSSGVTVQRQRLIMEELGETAAAFHDRNLINFADGLADTLYVVAGTAVVYGLKIVDAWSDALEQRTAPVIAPRLCPYENTMTHLSKLSSSTSRLFRSMLFRDLGAIHEFTCELIENLFEFSRDCGIPLAAVFDEVHSSNMSKNLAPCDGVEKYANPKLVKGPGYRPPNVALVLGIQTVEDEIRRAEAGA